MVNSKKAALAALLAFPVVPHDFFISICTIRHAAADRRLEITWRITTHDLEHALEPLAGGSLALGSARELPAADSLIADYLSKHLKLTINGAVLHANYLGRQVEHEDLYCFLQADDIAHVDGLTVACTLLQETFAGQQNIVHLETTGLSTITHIFLPDDKPFTFARR